MSSISEARAEVQRAYEKARCWSDADEPRSFWEFERELWTMLLALGRALVGQFLARQAAGPRAVQYSHAGERYVLDERPRTTVLGTMFGKVRFTRPVGSM